MAEETPSNAENYVRELLKRVGGPVSPKEILAKSTDQGFSALGTRAAFLRLVDHGEARFTRESKLEAVVPERALDSDL